jgi:hypothetical protein
MRALPEHGKRSSESDKDKGSARESPVTDPAAFAAQDAR